MGARRHFADRFCLPLLAGEPIRPVENPMWYNFAAMEKPIGEHIRKLEERLRLLSNEVMANRISLKERNQIEAEIRAVNIALSHYRAALELENTLPPR